MPGPEANVERPACAEAKAAGWKVRKIKFLDVNGAPDRVFGKGGRTVFIEFKCPIGGILSDQQLRRIKELREDFGQEVHVCDRIEQVRDILGLPDK